MRSDTVTVDVLRIAELAKLVRVPCLLCNTLTLSTERATGVQVLRIGGSGLPAALLKHAPQWPALPPRSPPHGRHHSRRHMWAALEGMVID